LLLRAHAALGSLGVEWHLIPKKLKSQNMTISGTPKNEKPKPLRAVGPEVESEIRVN